jgi:NodT family efflux transporter outer membrane factor (OMF) lipoprotein
MRCSLLRMAVVGILATTVAGCALSPDFKPLKVTAPAAYTASALPPETANAGGTAQRFAFAKKLSAQWWTLFHSPALDRLIRQGLAGSPSLAAAQAALQEARENLAAANGSLRYPGADASAGISRQKVSAATNGGNSAEFDLYNASVGVSYTLDLFGGAKRQIEAIEAQVDYQRFRYEAAYLTLASNIATTAIQEASLRSQAATIQDILAAEQKQLAVVKRQFELGAVPKASVLSQQSQLAITAASLPPIEKRLAFTRHALAVLIGQMPSQATLPEFRLDSLQLPETLPVSLPSVLTRQRPDIRAAEALLHQASAEVGVATANLYPQITLSGSLGATSMDFGKLLDGPNTFWSIGAGLVQPLFHGGALHAKRRAAIAVYNQAAAQYRQTVLGAFRDVADALRALDTDARTLQAEEAAEEAAKTNLDLTQRQFELGAVNYLSFLVAQRDYQQVRIGRVTAQAQRYADTVALFQALGGGWWNRPATDTGAPEKPTKS